MIDFCYTPRNWTLINDDRLQISYIESYGRTVKELIKNCLISIEDWNGNEAPDRELEDLNVKDYDRVVALFEESVVATLPIGKMNVLLGKPWPKTA